jgi:hypothetical protein
MVAIVSGDKMKKLVFYVFLFSSGALFAENETQVRLYRPFTEGANLPAMQVSATYDGRCMQQSDILVREDAWRCDTQSQTYDPCFLKPGSKDDSLYCLQTPWSGATVKINSKQTASNDSFRSIDMAKGKPWAVEMQNGKHCIAIEETQMIDNQPLSYLCQGGEYLLGRLQRCKAHWSVLWSNGATIEQRKISEVWF